MRSVNNKNVVAFGILFLTCFMFGCRPRIIAKNYSVSTIDTDDDRSLYYNLENGDAIGRVEPCVVAVGWNDKYIIVKRRIRKETTILYYILEIDKDSKYANPRDVVIGPLTETEFWEKRRNLHVSTNLMFSITY